MELEDRIAVVGRTWMPTQQMHPGNVAWHGSGCDGAPPADVVLDGERWFAEIWHLDDGTAEVEGHFSPRLSPDERRSAFDEIAQRAPRGSISLVSNAPMADTVRSTGAHEVGGPFFLLHHRGLDQLPDPPVPLGYSIVTAREAGERARVDAHCLAWDPARITELLGLEVTGREPPSSFTLDKYKAMKGISIYSPTLDLVVLDRDGNPAAFALGWLDTGSRSVLFEPVGTTPKHTRRGLATAACMAVMRAAHALGATQAVVGPRGDDAYPAPRHVYQSLGFSELARTCTLTWGVI